MRARLEAVAACFVRDPMGARGRAMAACLSGGSAVAAFDALMTTWWRLGGDLVVT